MRFILGLCLGMIVTLCIVGLMQPQTLAKTPGLKVLSETLTSFIDWRTKPEPSANKVQGQHSRDHGEPLGHIDEAVMEELDGLEPATFTVMEQAPGANPQNPRTTEQETVSEQPPDPVEGEVGTPDRKATPAPEIGEVAVWTPFYSEASALGFAQQLKDTFDQEFAVRRRAPANYEVVFIHHNPQEWEVLQQRMGAVFGGP